MNEFVILLYFHWLGLKLIHTRCGRHNHIAENSTHLKDNKTATDWERDQTFKLPHHLTLVYPSLSHFYQTALYGPVLTISFESEMMSFVFC